MIGGPREEQCWGGGVKTSLWSGGEDVWDVEHSEGGLGGR